jgi:putative toxin-antitoxin system antitoxin component (TIGR02293 family)
MNTPAEPVGIGEIVEIVARAIEVFGDRTKALRWLRTPIPSLGDATPQEMLEHDGGIEQVEEALGRVERGVW